MNSICFFATYFKGNTIPYYIKVFVKELKQFFPELIFITSNTDLLATEKNFLTENRITLQVEANEGFDFGLWYKAIQKHDIEKYSRVAFINDSTVLFKSLSDFLKWSETSKADLVGMTESFAVSHHIQSYFLLFKK
ncbi:MAG: hypothetical protein JNM96_04005, partial [Bacteroidia bacterium]|nr:hypothetical protein [Bacteroidia bacterium]